MSNHLAYQGKEQLAVGIRMITLFSFNSDIHPSTVQLDWTIGDSLTLNEFYPVVPFELLSYNGFTDVSLDFTIPNVMTGSIQTQLNLSQFCGGFLSIQKINENQFQFAVNPSTDLPSDIQWSNGSTDGSTLRPIQAQDLSLDILAKDGSCSAHMAVSIEDPDFNRLNIGYIAQQPALAEDLSGASIPVDQIFNVINFKITEADGTQYSTYEVVQDASSYFEIQSMNYELNELGQKTILIDALFSARLISTDRSKIILLEDAKATFAVAIP